MGFQYSPYSPNRLDVGVCGRSFHGQYVDPNRQPREYENLPQARGSVFHLAAAEITRAIIQGKTTFEDEEIRRMVAAGIRQHPAAAEQTGDILRMVHKYLMNPPDFLVSDAAVEKKLAIRMGNPEKNEDEYVKCDFDDPEALARGIADIYMVSDDLTHAVIIDHKTQLNIEDANTFQLGFYAWLAVKINPCLEEVKTILHFAQYGKYREHIWDKEQLAGMEQEILTRILACEDRSEWEITPNTYCQYCPFLSDCPAHANDIETDEAGISRPRQSSIKIHGDTQKALQVASRYIAHDHIATEAKKEVRAHVEFSQCAIEQGNFRFSFEPKEEIDWDYVNKHQREDAYRIFEKHRIDPKRFMGFSQTFSKHIDRAELPALSEELGKLFKRKSRTEFHIKKL